MNNSAETEQKAATEGFESRLVPILREGIGVVRMILFKELRDSILSRKPECGRQLAGRLAGAAINELFGSKNDEEDYVNFAREHASEINALLTRLATDHENLRIPLTDTIRTQYICDRQEGLDNPQLLLRARELGILIEEREVPMPARFIHLVRVIGAAHGLLAPAPAANTQ